MPSEAPVTLLLMDDNSRLRMRLAALFGSVPHFSVVADADTAAEGLAAARRGQPDVVVMEVRLPDGSGVKACRVIRSELPATRVVMLTSSREERDLAQSYALGANAYVVKPVEFQQFISAVKELGVFWGVINEPPPERN